MRQFELICSECRISPCDEKSLWCMYRFLTSPNAAQKEMAKHSKAVVLIPRHAPKPEKARKKYERDYYQRNRPKKIAAALKRYYDRKQQKYEMRTGS